MRHSRGFGYMLTLTAPGNKQHFYPGTNRPCPCTPAGLEQGLDVAGWNSQHSKLWNHFITELRRLVGVEDASQLPYGRGIEVQTKTRNALHDHVLLVSPVPLSQRKIRALAVRCGFGCQVKLRAIEQKDRVRAGVYAAKYATKATDQRGEVPWLGDVVDKRTGEISRGPVRASYRTWAQSQHWGPTMREAAAARARALYRAKAGSLMLSELDVSGIRDQISDTRAASEMRPPPG